MKKWKAVVGIVLVFILGVVAGGLVSMKVCRHKRPGPPPVSAVMDKLDKRLGLNTGQHAQVEAIIRDARGQMDSVRKETLPRIDSIMGSARDRIRAALTPEQREKFERLVKRWDERRKHREEE